MTVVGGAVVSFSQKQKINAKSSTEEKLIGMDDALPQVLWTRFFIECQGYATESNVIYQGNKSTIVLEHKGKDAGSKRTKHMKIRYFFIKDKIVQKEIEVKYCPTERIWSDTMTKLQQGQLFQEMWAMIMNRPFDYDK